MPSRPHDPCFLEVQFPISRLSQESFRERKAVAGQTLTGLGKWWGRKPLILCRAILLGLLLPASDNPTRDREVFLRLLTMDADGLRRRKNRSVLSCSASRQRPSETAEEVAFAALPYHQKLTYCRRPEQVEGPAPESWTAINAHLGSSARNLPELVAELSQRRFGRRLRVGDAFCGGGSVPFEAARLGCDVHASDLNPVACLLTWASLNLLGEPEAQQQLRTAQQAAFDTVQRQLTRWGVEHNERGERADAYLYCLETRCPACGWLVPLAPSWVIANKTACAALLEPDPTQQRFDIRIVAGLDRALFRAARSRGTVRNSRLICPNPKCRQETSLARIRSDGSAGLRAWENDDLIPRPEDIFQERLYCVRWVGAAAGWMRNVNRIERRYAAPDAEDLRREALVLSLLGEHLAEWQSAGYLPTPPIETGVKTEEPMRTRGWRYWHHLFHPRQLLQLGLFAQEAARTEGPCPAGLLLLLGRLLNWNSRLCRWLPTQGGGIGGGKDTFDNMALNPLYNFCVRGFPSLASCRLDLPAFPLTPGSVTVADCREVRQECDVWITDPPYADYINYHEISEFFLAWYERPLRRLFPDWDPDSRRPLAVQGTARAFRQSMADCYRNLARHMPEDGVQVVLFNHQEEAVWADLTLILWAAGLRVTAAWCVRTETAILGIKQGQHVHGTVVLVLRKAPASQPVLLEEIARQLQAEVHQQVRRMLAAEDEEESTATAGDYQVAACAAAVRLLTRCPVRDLDLQQELSREGRSPVEEVIRAAVVLARPGGELNDPCGGTFPTCRG